MVGQENLFGAEVGGFAGELPDELRRSRPVRVLEESLAKGRVPHGLLLYGEELESLELVAMAFAGALLEAPGRAREHPDLLTLRPAGKSRQIRIGDRGEPQENSMRQFLRDIHKTANRGGRKVAVLYEADRLNAATANAFLKTLEEPPGDTVILLLTTRPYDLLDTIRSRCFSFRIQGVAGALADPGWQEWTAAYRQWLDALRNSPRKPREVADVVMGLYGLVARFDKVLETLADASWEREKEQLPTNVPAEQQAALEAGNRKALRQRLMTGIERITRDWALQDGPEASGRALGRAVAALEHSARMADVFNLREDAALEAFLLASLRSWTMTE